LDSSDPEAPTTPSPTVDSSVTPLPEAAAPSDATGSDTTESDETSSDAWVSQSIPELDCGLGPPIPVCVEYFAFQAKCFNDPGFINGACQPAALDIPGNDVDATIALCEINLQRAEQACR
jgi:hypothetical protein